MYMKDVLPNGVCIITEAIPYLNSATIGIWVNAGTKSETGENNGISHFIEHLMFKGTKNRSAKDIAEIMDGVGGHLNAFTEKEQTCYYAKVMHKHVPLAMDVLCDMLLNSAFPQDEIEKEQGVVIEEIKMYEDAPDEKIYDIFTKTLWDGHPLGRPTLGSQKIIQGIGRKDIVGFIKKHYTPDNIIVVAVGRVEHQRIVNQLEKLLSGMKGTCKYREQTVPIRAERKVEFKDCEQVYLCLGANGVSQRDDNRYQLTVLDSILGGSMSSRLFQEIREKYGLVYSVSSFQIPFKNAGIFGVYASTGPKNIQSVIELVLKIFKDIQRKGVTERELTTAKEHLKGSIALALESSTNRMIRSAKSEIYHGRQISHREVVKKINAVKKRDVQMLARQILDENKMSFAVLGPVNGSTKLW
ncbi:MAG: insulinase family protein [Armatimonadetes bacterium]|nr:insulinase family protein [Armatimonadota bacterium]